MDQREAERRQYLDAMGIDMWERRDVPPSQTAVTLVQESGGQIPAAVESNELFRSPASGVASMDWGTLEDTVRGCVKCRLHKSRSQTVFGVGSRKAEWVFVGEGPGVEEDRQGEPFVGRAGQLLNAMLAAIGLRREQVYIANVLKCRPPNNRDPQMDEVECCEPYLLRQIELLNPSIILALGRHAAHSLLKTELPLSKLRGRRLSYHGIPLIVTYHPAYLLRNPVDKRKAWDDLCLAMSLVGKP